MNAKKKNLKKKTFFSNKRSVLNIYKIFEKNLSGLDKSLVAVSGGPDSLAMAFLAKHYSILNSVKFNYALVDHKLRKESSIEATKVVQILKKIGIKCKILVWKGKKPNSNIQKVARNNRYHLLIKECKRLKIKTILLGHQMNDLHENFFLRMTRGSGLKGLVSLGKNTKFSDINLLRPLINIPKKDLENLTLDIFKKFVKDPSNQNNDFSRVRIRKILKEFQKEGLEAKKINLTINNLKSASNALDFFTKKNINDNAVYFKKKQSCFLNKFFFLKPDEVVLRSMSTILNNLSGRYYPPRGKKIKRLILLMTSKNKAKKTTLGGCIIEKVYETVIINKE